MPFLSMLSQIAPQWEPLLPIHTLNLSVIAKGTTLGADLLSGSRDSSPTSSLVKRRSGLGAQGHSLLLLRIERMGDNLILKGGGKSGAALKIRRMKANKIDEDLSLTFAWICSSLTADNKNKYLLKNQ